MVLDGVVPVRLDHLYEGSKNGGTVPRWVGVYDDKNRVVAAGWFNCDTGNSREFAYDPRYPEKYSALGIRLGVNYLVYAMTH